MCLDEILNTPKLTEDHKTCLEKYSSLSHLSLNLVGLKSLENFPHLETLKCVRKKNL